MIPFDPFAFVKRQEDHLQLLERRRELIASDATTDEIAEVDRRIAELEEMWNRPNDLRDPKQGGVVCEDDDPQST